MAERQLGDTLSQREPELWEQRLPLLEIENMMARSGHSVPWNKDAIIVAYQRDGGHHSRAICRDLEAAEVTMTLQEAWETEWPECSWCEGLGIYAPAREISLAQKLLEIQKREHSDWTDTLRQDCVLWRQTPEKLETLRSEAQETHDRTRMRDLETRDSLELWGIYCAGVVQYQVSGARSAELAAWIRNVTDPKIPRNTQESIFKTMFEEAIRQARWTWALWISPASIDIRGAAARCVAKETRRIDCSSYTISYGWVPDLFVEGITASGRTAAVCQSERAALLAYMMYTSPPGKTWQREAIQAGLESVIAGCEALVAESE